MDFNSALATGDTNPSLRAAKGERLVFVGGAPRSGTTLFQLILDSHPRVFGGPEFDCLPNIAHAWRRVVDALDAGRITAFCTRDQIDTCFGTLVENLLLPAADARGADVLCEKTPFNVLVFSFLLEMLPRSRGVHVVRDPRAVVSSMLAVGARSRAKGAPTPDFVETVGAAVRFTRQCLDSGFAAAERFPDRLLTIQYESLVADPANEIKRVCGFLGVEFDDRMLAPDRQPHLDLDAILVTNDGTWVDPTLDLQGIARTRTAAWERDLTRDQIGLVCEEFRGHPLLRRLGYRFD
ncbi:sulfotransferase family protein [Fimbriiglobus ruber]|uniref:Sulfotransferase n=1 Tax=Fimbriiglobus ruber TaxID=1908690 RepID=A0A225DQC5_9BACT|nr:sulfotransferase [Fimbriiglobus ruber]OWK38565.1 hypothetical protein FRUB_07685 [Fimbriiglobus ruber]